MGLIIAGTSGVEAGVESHRGLRTIELPPGPQFVAQFRTGTMAAALAGGSAIFSMRFSPTAGSRVAYITRVRCMWNTIAAFTTPVTANRSLYLAKFSGGVHSGGTGGGNDAPLSKLNGAATSYFETGNGGDTRVANTGALTVGGGLTLLDTGWGHYRQALSGHGAAGAYAAWCWGEGPAEPATILAAGEGLAILNEAMDAGGTWQLSVIVEWYELPSNWA